MKSLTEEYGSFTAFIIGVEHELRAFFDKDAPAYNLPLGEKIRDVKMDLYNNKLGREAAQKSLDPKTLVETNKASVVTPQLGTTEKAYP